MKRASLTYVSVRIISLLVLLPVMNLLYKRLLFEKDVQEYSSIITLVREVPLDADIIYVGESSNNTYREDDLDKRKISDFVADCYPELGVYDMTKSAAHAGVFKVLLRQIPKESKAGTIIVTLNLRSFNAQWIHSPLETSLQKSLVLLRPYPPLVNRALLSFKAYEIKTDKERQMDFKKQWAKDRLKFPYEFPYNDVAEWDRWMAHHGISDRSGGMDQAGTELACHYIKAYGFQIDTLKNPRIDDFNEIVELARGRGWNLVFNLMAENMEKAGELVGEDLTFLMEQNRELLKNYYRSKGVLVVDNLSCVEDQQFIDQSWTTEHYGEKGRKSIAKSVAQALKTWYPEEYIDMGY
jgi:hypothetical protein